MHGPNFCSQVNPISLEYRCTKLWAINIPYS